jgi:outer membrane biosynthesis protein TonB
MIHDYTKLIEALNRHSEALELHCSLLRAGNETVPAPVEAKPKRAKKIEPEPQPEPWPETVPEPQPEPQPEPAPEPQPEPTPELDEVIVEDESPAPEEPQIVVTFDEVKKATAPLSKIPDAVAEWKSWLEKNYNCRVTAGVPEKEYPVLLSKANELQSKYL